ncbi:PH domain-containing protein [Naasia lichenicola]|uniref:YdbS-like PH domain-containing protein n=1 Tax=Naasia lichenicola TaxID=2565933 RepID=A0A4S4FHT4_9MICO|nr:PH domain-containing protein [Naasia lichenicola]THG29588.1 hypothetical protein E6C64_12970 [Naasia lichenicola]
MTEPVAGEGGPEAIPREGGPGHDPSHPSDAVGVGAGTAAATRPGALADGEWHRLHPATPLLRGGIALIAIGGILVANLRDRILESFTGFHEGDPLDLVIDNGWLIPGLAITIGIVLVFVLGFYLSWRMHEFRVTDEVVEVRSGILFRTSRKARLDRIQGINIVRALVPRIFGAARLEVSVAGQDANVRLDYLGSAAADVLRRDVLRLASGAKAAPAAAASADGDSVQPRASALEQRVDEFLAPELDPTEAAPESVVRIHPARLFFSILLSGPTLILLALLAFGIPWVVITGDAYLLFGAVPALIGMTSFTVNRFTKSLRYSIAGTPNGVRIGFGLLSTSNETLPPGRIHAVDVTQPLLWRPAGWWQIRINRASSSSASSSGVAAATMVLPVGDRNDVERVLGLILPALMETAAADAVRVGMTGSGGDGYVGSPRRARVLHPLSWKRNGFIFTDTALLLRAGRIWRTLTIVPEARLQSVSLTQSTVGRALRVATVHAHTVSGPVTARIGALDVDTAIELFSDVSRVAITTGRADTSYRWGATP